MKEPSWSIQVKTKDGWICRGCGELDKELLDAHHIKTRRDYPELAKNTDNGRTLCLFCHAKTHFQKGQLREAVLILLRLLQILMKRTRWPKITIEDREAFRLVEMQGLTIIEASKLMDCHRTTVARSLEKIKKYYPHLCTKKGDFNILHLPDYVEMHVRQRF